MPKSGQDMTIPNKNYFYYSAGISILLIIIVYAIKNYLPPEVPLFYGKAVGQDQLVPTLGLLYAPLTSLTITFINFLLTRVIKDSFLQKILVLISFFVSILIAITTIKIIFLVGHF